MILSLRRFETTDAVIVVALFRDTVRRVNSRDYSEAQIAAWASDQIDVKAWARELSSTFTIVAELDKVLVGFGTLEENGLVDRFYVHADHQLKGIGRAILRAIEIEAGRLDLRRLFTEASITAKEFFEGRGFTVIEPQTVEVRGQSFLNYRMEKSLTERHRF